MSSGFSIGLNALQANAGAIEVASKNIAASNVSGFKSTEYLFQESLSRAMQPSSGGRFGATGTGGLTRRSYSAGSTKYSASPLDMSINGEGMFTVGLFKEPSVEKTFYTRSGQFLTDRDGYVVSSSGLYLYGYQPNADATDVTDKVGPLKEPDSPMPPNPTSSAFVSVNLDARKPIVATTKIVAGEPAPVSNILDVNYPDTYSHVQQFPLYDKLGQQHVVSLYFRRVDENFYNIFVNVDGQVFAASAESGKITIDMPSKAAASTDASDTDQKPEGPKPVASFGFFEGNASGSLSGLAVDDKGFLRGQFTNGRTVVAGRLQIATFRGLGGLREVSNNTYQATDQSGDPLYGSGAEGIYGSIRANSVEEANTDMASELVRLMVQQRNYQANAQSIRTQVEILSVTIDVTR
ncbi:MAG: flagellar hook-basal body complex protein [Betaproteobacteria bacterium]|nr:flagellar hook-basal body complex protein [Betaproteobacteria bacterium]